MEDKIIYKNGDRVPKEIRDYYVKNGYCDKMIPLNADTGNEIAEILRERGIEV